MTIIKYGFYVDLLVYFKTLKNKKWLDKNRYVYHLKFGDFFINYSKKINKITYELKKNIPEKNSYRIYLTKFGTYGSYELPNKIFLNIKQPIENIPLVLEHEIMHLLVEKKVKKENLKHAEKEKLADSLTKK